MWEAVFFGRITCSLAVSAMPWAASNFNRRLSALSFTLLGAFTTFTVHLAVTPLAAVTVTTELPFFLPVRMPSAATVTYLVLELA